MNTGTTYDIGNIFSDDDVVYCHKFSICIDLKTLLVELFEDVQISKSALNTIDHYLYNNDKIIINYFYDDLHLLTETIKEEMYNIGLSFINKCIKEKENEISNLNKIKKEKHFNNIIRKQKLNKINKNEK